MPASLDHIHPGTPMGANLIGDGATFRVLGAACPLRSMSSATSTIISGPMPACSRAMTRGIGAASFPARRTASATCSMSSGREARDSSAILMPASWNPLSRATASSAAPISLARERVRHAAVPRVRDLPAPRRDVLHAEPAAQGRHVPRCRAQAAVSGRARASRRCSSCRFRNFRPASASATTAPIIFRPRWILPWRMPISPPTSHEVNGLLDCEGPAPLSRWTICAEK